MGTVTQALISVLFFSSSVLSAACRHKGDLSHTWSTSGDAQTASLGSDSWTASGYDHDWKLSSSAVPGPSSAGVLDRGQWSSPFQAASYSSLGQGEGPSSTPVKKPSYSTQSSPPAISSSTVSHEALSSSLGSTTCTVFHEKSLHSASSSNGSSASSLSHGLLSRSLVSTSSEKSPQSSSHASILASSTVARQPSSRSVSSTSSRESNTESSRSITTSSSSLSHESLSQSPSSTSSGEPRESSSQSSSHKPISTTSTLTHEPSSRSISSTSSGEPRESSSQSPSHTSISTSSTVTHQQSSHSASSTSSSKSALSTSVPFKSTSKSKSTSVSTSSTVKSTSSTLPEPVISSNSCFGTRYEYNELLNFGGLPADTTNILGETIGGFGAIAIDLDSFQNLTENFYVFTLYAISNRGWDTEGTLNYQPRIHFFNIIFPNGPGGWTYEVDDTILLTDPDGVPLTGLNPDLQDYATFDGFPPLPVATYSGDGFGGSGSGGRRVSLNPKGFVLAPGDTFWVSDEYGPYIYQFDRSGTMLQAIQPPNAILPLRNGSLSFTTDDGFYPNRSSTVIPVEPTQGRENNQGFEGLTMDPSGSNLYVLLQSAAAQDGGETKASRRYTRFLRYDVTGTPRLTGEWVVPLPLYTDTGQTLVAAQSEIHYIDDTSFFILARDKGHGGGQADSTSIYRHIDVFNIFESTNIVGQFDAFNSSILDSTRPPSQGILNSTIKPALYCEFIDFNNNTVLNSVGAHNGGPQDGGLLNEKWESIAVVKVPAEDNQYFVLSFSDNDFITQDGVLNRGEFHYSDPSGFTLDNQALIFKITIS